MSEPGKDLAPAVTSCAVVALMIVAVLLFVWWLSSWVPRELAPQERMNEPGGRIDSPAGGPVARALRGADRAAPAGGGR